MTHLLYRVLHQLLWFTLPTVRLWLAQLVDIFDVSSNKWTNARLSANRSNLDAANVADRYVAFGSGNIDGTAKITFDFFDGQTGEWAPSHGHLPGNPAVTSIGNVAMFANGDGSVDVLALNSKCPSVWRNHV